jgi:hypothetical protein
MTKVLLLFIIASVAVGLLFYYRVCLPGPIATLLAYRLGLPARWDREIRAWLLSPNERLIGRLGGASYVVCLIVGVLSIGWLWGLVLVAATGIIGWWISSGGARSAAPFLAIAVARARERASAFRLSGDGARAGAADDLAARIERYARQAPMLTTAEIGSLPHPTRPSDIADLLEGLWRNHDRDDAEALREWLEREEWSPFPHEPHEQRRVQLLMQVKQEIVAGGGEQYANGAQLTALVAELRAFAT